MLCSFGSIRVRFQGGIFASLSQDFSLYELRLGFSFCIKAALVLSGWPNKMRKELNSERKGDDNDHEGEDNNEASVSKKHRVVWSETVPKRILQLNVEKLPRENIASHLQILRFLCHPVLEAGNNSTCILPIHGPSTSRRWIFFSVKHDPLIDLGTLLNFVLLPHMAATSINLLWIQLCIIICFRVCHLSF